MTFETGRLKYEPSNTESRVKHGVNWYKEALTGEHQTTPEKLLDQRTVHSESLKNFLLKFIAETIPNPTKQFSDDLQTILNSQNLTNIRLLILKLGWLKTKNPEYSKQIETIKSNFEILRKCEKQTLEMLGIQRLEVIEKVRRIKPEIVITTTVRNNSEGIKELYKNICEQKRDFPIAWLVINNSSTDKTRKFLDEIKNEEFVVVLDSNEKSGWPVFGRNFVINTTALLLQQRAIDDHVYVGRVDSDDLLAQPESLKDFYRKLQKLDYPAELVGKSIIQRDNKDVLYPSNIRPGDPTIRHPWEILPAGISAFSGLTRADIFIQSTLPIIPTIEDSFSRVLWEIIHNLGEITIYDDQLIFGIKNEKTNNQNRSSQMASTGKHQNIDVGNYDFEGLRALYFEIILEITRQQITGELYR